MRIQTTRNVVITEQPEPDDVLVRVSLMVPGDEPGTRSVRHLPYQPVSEYQEAVDWAVGMADRMAYPIHVVPHSHNDIFRTNRWDQFRELLAGRNAQERGERRPMIGTKEEE